MPCAGTCCRRRSCAAATSRSPRRGSGTRPARSCCRCGTRGTSSPSTPTSPGTRVRVTDEPSDHVLDRYIRAKSRRLVEEMTAAMDAYDLFGACARIRAVRRRAHQLVHPPQPATLLGRRPRRHRHPAHGARRRRARRRAAAAVRRRRDPRRAPSRAPYRQRAPARLAERRRTSCRRRAGHDDGPRARRLLGDAVGAQGPRPAGPPAVVQPDGGRPRRRQAGAVRRDHRRRGQRPRRRP